MNTINFAKLAAIARFSSQYSNLGEDYVFTRLTSTEGFTNHTDGPYRIDGMSWILCLDGSMDIVVNLEKVSVRPSTILLTPSDSMVELKQITSDSLDCYILFVSRDFIHDINLDVNILSNLPRPPRISGSSSRSALLINISSDEADLFRHYLELLHHNTVANRDDIYVRSIARCIIAALFYQLFQKASTKFNDNTAESRPRTRRSIYTDEFIRLLQQYHRSQRSVAFYASKLFISPKYLSLIIKDATGKSAAELIDDYVLLEAKNLLRFSGKNIQQVAYELNFPNQSAFGKYFKHLTGMSPSEYQRT